MSVQQRECQFCPWDGQEYLPSDTLCSLCQEPRPAAHSSSPGWQKVLYNHQQSSQYPDNYVHRSTFLKSIRTDENHDLDLLLLIKMSWEVSVSVVNVICFLVLYDILLNKSSLVMPVFSLFFCGVVVATQLYVLIIPKLPTAYQILRVAKSIAILVGTLVILSPVVRDSYINYADDTVYSLTLVLITFYLFANDYSSTPSRSLTISHATLSTQFFSMLLASRLDSNNKVIMLFLASLVIFIFYGIFRQALRQYAPRFYGYFLLSYALAICVLLHHYYSFTYALLYTLVLLFLSLLSPIWIVYLYQYKNTVKGPWDLPPNVNNYKLE